MYRLVEEYHDVVQVINLLKDKQMLACDTETTGLDPHMAKLVSVQISDGEDAWYFSIAHEVGKALDLESVEVLKKFISETPMAYFNANFDAHILKHNWKIDVKVSHDPQLLLLILGKEKAGLKWAAESLLGRKDVIEFKHLFEPNKEMQYQTLNPNNKMVLKYGCDDAFYTVLLTKLLLEDLKEKELEHIYEMELKFQEALRDMEYRGLNVSEKVLIERTQDFLISLRKLEDKFWELVEQKVGDVVEVFPLNSAKKLAALLYDKLGYECLMHTAKGGRSASVEALEQLLQDDIVRTLLEIKHCNSIYSTYLTKAGAYIQDGKVHPDHLQIGESGRPYTRNPNIQQWPIPCREAIFPDADHYFLLADYKSAELRIIAGWSQDEFLKDVFAKGLDPHRATMAAMSDKITYEGMTKEQREMGKVLNYGLIYGMEPYGLARRLLISTDKADELLKRYFSKIPGVVRFIDEVEKYLAKTTYTVTYFGRKRHIGLIKSPISGDRKKARRQAVNTRCQGTMADILKIVTNKIFHEARPKGIRIVEEVHDSFLFQVHKSWSPEDAMRTLKELMELKIGDVVMEVSFKVGALHTPWGKLEDTVD